MFCYRVVETAVGMPFNKKIDQDWSPKVACFLYSSAFFPIEQYSASEPVSAWIKQLEARARDTSSHEKKVAIICRDQSDITIIKELFGDELLTKVHIFTGPPEAGPKSLLSIQKSRSCIIVVDARTMEEELHHKSFGTPYEDMLRAAKDAVGKNINIYPPFEGLGRGA